MVYNRQSKETKYYKPGDEFDGGELVLVHQRGGVVRRNEDYFVYPIGVNLDQHVDAKVADEYPELKSAADKLREMRQSRRAAPPVEPEPQAPSTAEQAKDEPAGTPVGVEPIPAPEVKPAEGAEAREAEQTGAGEKPAEAKPAPTKRRTSRPQGSKKRP
jgi:hypothetical protein